MTEPDTISVKGAREHNLKSVDVEIPKKRLVVFTGVSGSGKSSLAFDTLYAEGQRRYVESLSSYARQFLGQMEKPRYDTLRGLSPTISIEQKAASNNPRSTVGTITEVHDYLRVLYASIGEQHCPSCGRKVGKQTPQQIVDAILAMPAGSRILVLAPLVQNRKGEYRELLGDAHKRGFSRVRVDGAVHSLEERLSLDKKLKHDIELVVDRLVVKEGIRGRLTDSVETALREGKGTLVVADADKEQKVGPGIDPEGYKAHDRFFSELNACPTCGISFGELAPQAFSFNSPLGSCTECQGLGTRAEMDADLIIPDPSLTIRDGAVEPWASGMEKGEGWTFEFVEHLSRSLAIDLDTPWSKLSKQHRDVILLGTQAAGVKGYRIQWEGVLNQLYRRFKATGSEAMRRYYMRFFSDKPCPACGGERLRAESRAVKIRGVGIVELSRRTIHETLAWLDGLSLKGSEARIAEELLKEIRNRLRFLVDVGLSYLTLDRPGPSLSGGESQRIRLASQMGSELTGVIYILDEPSIGLHQRDNGKLLGTLKRLRDIGNSVIVVEHDEETMEAADWIVDFGPGAGEHGGRVVSAGTPAHVMADPASLTGAYLAGRAEIAVPERRRPVGKARLVVAGATENNLKDVTVAFPLGLLRRRHRRLGGRQVDAGERHPPPGALPAPLRLPRGARPPQVDRRPRADRQGHRHQPAAHRAHPALQPGHVHQGLRPGARRLRPDAGGPFARVPARPLQLQREGRPLRGLPGRRHEDGGDALPRRRARALRGLPGQALQRGHPQGAVQGEEHRRGARPLGAGGHRSTSRTTGRSSASSTPSTTWGSGT